MASQYLARGDFHQLPHFLVDLWNYYETLIAALSVEVRLTTKLSGKGKLAWLLRMQKT